MSQLSADRDDTIGGNGIVGTQARLDIEPSFFASLLHILKAFFKETLLCTDCYF